VAAGPVAPTAAAGPVPPAAAAVKATAATVVAVLHQVELLSASAIYSRVSLGSASPAYYAVRTSSLVLELHFPLQKSIGICSDMCRVQSSSNVPFFILGINSYML
jgi:hypothetical protein